MDWSVGKMVEYTMLAEGRGAVFMDERQIIAEVNSSYGKYAYRIFVKDGKTKRHEVTGITATIDDAISIIEVVIDKTMNEKPKLVVNQRFIDVVERHKIPRGPRNYVAKAI